MNTQRMQQRRCLFSTSSFDATLTRVIMQTVSLITRLLSVKTGHNSIERTDE